MTNEIHSGGETDRSRFWAKAMLGGFAVLSAVEAVAVVTQEAPVAAGGAVALTAVGVAMNYVNNRLVNQQ